MAGGIGSRFWPVSRNDHPKQFLDILGTGKTLIQQTFERFKKICPPENIYIVTNEIYKDLITTQIEGINLDQVLCEPERRNTAPCIAYASFKIKSLNENANIVVAPSDHIIKQEDVFVNSINSCLDFTKNQDCLVTLGIQPSRPDTGYGYIQFIDGKKQNDIKKVKTFTEKPNLEMAKFFLKSGDFLWNAGIFIWNVKSILHALEIHLPDIYQIFKTDSTVYGSNKEASFIKKAYEHCTNISIDFGVMEKADNVHVLGADFGWSDLGTWGSLYEHIPHDENKNAIVGKSVLMYESSNNIVNVKHGKLAVLQGLDDYIVIDTKDVLLICKKEDEQQIRQYVNDVKLKMGEKFV